MSADWKPLGPVRHRSHGYAKQTSLVFARQDVCVPLLLGELSAAVASVPLAFAKRADGSVALMGLQGLHGGENLCLDPQGRWRATYIPICYRVYPMAFFPMPDVQGAIQPVLCFDHASGLYRESPDAAAGEQRFFDDKGEPQPALQQQLAMLKAMQTGKLQTDTATAALSAAGLLEPWVWPFDNPETGPNARPLVGGLLRVNQQALAAKEGDALKQLQACGALLLAHAQLLSVGRLPVLQKWYAPRQPPPAPATAPTDWSAQQLGEVLKFDWMK